MISGGLSILVDPCMNGGPARGPGSPGRSLKPIQQMGLGISHVGGRS